MSAIVNLGKDAAYEAILRLEYKLALEWLERARCVFWNQALGHRSPVDRLSASYPDLASHLQVVSRQLQNPTYQSPTSQDSTDDPVDPEQVAQHRRLCDEYDGVLSQVRNIAGFEDFLRPVKSEQLVCAARNGPVVVINCHPAHCDALVILPGQEDIQHLSLPNFTENKARRAQSEIETLLRRKQLSERGVSIRVGSGEQKCFERVLSTLWYDVIKPVLDFLGYTNEAPIDNIPHITWCPTGALSFLPLHAAGDYNQPRSKVFDYVISSYTPSLTAFLASVPSSLSPTSRVLAISHEHTLGHAPLPGAVKELECMRTYTQNTAQYSQLTNDQATPAAVIDAMEGHDWVHLACHARQNVDDPNKSGFCLHGGTLDLASVNRRSFRNKGLEFLSACQTAASGTKLPDEAIRLASGLIMAGFPSVIATMWSVVDDDAPVVADKVYVELMKGGKVGSGEAGGALHSAVAVLREQIGDKEFARWVPYIHFGS